MWLGLSWFFVRALVPVLLGHEPQVDAVAPHLHVPKSALPRTWASWFRMKSFSFDWNRTLCSVAALASARHGVDAVGTSGRAADGAGDGVARDCSEGAEPRRRSWLQTRSRAGIEEPAVE
jgi:hypothetical protein